MNEFEQAMKKLCSKSNENLVPEYNNCKLEDAKFKISLQEFRIGC
jgi:hypothetical protein